MLNYPSVVYSIASFSHSVPFQFLITQLALIGTSGAVVDARVDCEIDVQVERIHDRCSDYLLLDCRGGD